MKIVIIFTIILYISNSLTLTTNHNNSPHQHKYWFSKNNPATGNDDKWDYCDYKCLAFENKINDKDFVVVVLSAPLKERFAACYVKTGTSFTLWSKVTENAYYEKYCGEDYKDWIVEGGFGVDKVFGVGIGGSFDESEIYG